MRSIAVSRAGIIFVIGASLVGAPPVLAQGSVAASPLANFDSAWAAVSRTYWDTALVHGRWRAAHDSLRLVAAQATDTDGVRATIRALIAVPAQSHFVLMPHGAVPDAEDAARDAAPGTTGLDVRMIGDTLVVWRVHQGSPAALVGIRSGAIITHFDTIAVEAVRTLLVASPPDDPEQARRILNTVAMSRLAGRVGDTLRLTLTRTVAGRQSAGAHTLVRAPLSGRATRVGNLPPMVIRASIDSVPLGDGRFAPVIGFSAWFPVIAAELDEALFAARGTRGLIIDLRGNPGGLIGMLAGVSGHFLDSAVSLGTMHARGATIRFVANPRTVDRAGARVEIIDAPLAILVDGFTGSTSEFFASGMQALGRARVFGVRTAGQALPAMMARLPNGDVLMHAIADHEDALGRRVEGLGVQPDEVTPLTRADLIAGHDAALEAARAWLARAPR